jgi:putative sigma-54 modulation protein
MLETSVENLTRRTVPMHLDITGRHIEITPALRKFAEDKLMKLDRLLEGPVEVHVVLEIEKHRHTAEVQVKSRTAFLSGKQETGDLYASINEVADKLERQALKHKEKIQDHKHRKGPRDPEIAAVIEANANPAPTTGTTPSQRTPRIVRTRRHKAKPLSPEDAALELDATGEDLLVFRNAETDRFNVVYRQKDGNIGLVEPEP